MSTRKARVAVVGCGYWGQNLVRNFSQLGALEAVVGRTASTVDAVVARYGSRAASFGEVLDDRAIDAIVVAAPAAQHYALAMQGLDAGKHVFVEKPLARSRYEAEELVARAERADRRLMVGHLLQYHAAFVRLKALARDGELGRLRYIYSNRVSLGRVRRDEDVLWSFAPHDVSMILALVGQEPDRVHSTGADHLHERAADVTMTHLAFPGGERAHVFASWLHPFKEHKLVAIGSTGMAVFDDGEPWASKLVLYRHRLDGSDDIPVARTTDGVPVALDEIEPLRAECAHFLDCIEHGHTPRTDGREGLRVVSVLERAAHALARGGAGEPV